MRGQGFSGAESVAVSHDMLAAWRVSGGAIEALAGLDGRAADGVRSRRDGMFGDDGLRASMNTALASCADDGLRASMNTALASCVDDGLRATMNTALASCVDDGLRANSPSVTYC